MWRDPIVADVRRIRSEIGAECGHDLTKILEYLRTKEKKHRETAPRPDSRQVSVRAVAEETPPYGQ